MKPETERQPNRHVLQGDLHALEYAIADYIVRWGQHLPGVHSDTIAGTPCAVANMAMTVIRKAIVGQYRDDAYAAGWQHASEAFEPDFVASETKGAE